MRTQAYNTLGVALARTGRLTEAVEQIERSIGPGRGARAAAGGLPRVYKSRCALQLARPAPQHRDVPARARDRKKVGDLAFQSRLYAKSRCGLLRAHDRCEAEGVEAGASRHRPRPPARSARPPGRTADRSRPDSPVQRRAHAGVRDVRGGPRAGRAGRRGPSFCSPATTVSRRCISTREISGSPRLIWRRLRKSVSGRCRAGRADGVTVSLLRFAWRSLT